MIQHFPRQRHFGVRRNRQHDRRCAAAVVGQGYGDGANAMAVEQGLRFRPAYNLRGAIGIACHGKFRRIYLPQCELAWKKLDASFLGRKPRRETRCATGTGTRTTVGELLRGEDLAQRFGRRFPEQALDARNLDAIDAAAAGVRRDCGAGRFSSGAFGVGGIRHVATSR